MLIAQITDPHVMPEGSRMQEVVDPLPFVARAVAHLNALEPRVDAVLVTGDLADAGHPDSYRRLKRKLDSLRMPYYIIPGNHDDRAALRAAFADHTYLPRAGSFLHYVVDDYPVRLIGLDTLRPESHAGDGELCADRLQWFADQIGRSQKPTLIFMHHPPVRTHIQNMDAMGLHGAEAFGAVVQRHAGVIERVACGHIHRTIVTRWRGTTVAVAPGVAFQLTLELRRSTHSSFVMEPPGYLLHHWTPERELVTHAGVIGPFDGPYLYD